jgi:hypothetical protein
MLKLCRGLRYISRSRERSGRVGGSSLDRWALAGPDARCWQLLELERESDSRHSFARRSLSTPIGTQPLSEVNRKRKDLARATGDSAKIPRARPDS